MACVPYYALLFLATLSTFLIALVFGDTCELLFDSQPSSLGKLLNNSFNVATLAGTNDSLGSIFHKCVEGQSLLDIASNIGLNTSVINFTAIANEKIDNMSFNDIGSVNLTSVISLSSNPTSDANNTSVDLSSLTVEPFSSVISQTTNLRTNLTVLNDQLNRLLTNQSGILIGWNINIEAQTSEAYKEFNLTVIQIKNDIINAYNIINLLQELSTGLTTSITQVNSSALTMVVSKT